MQNYDKEMLENITDESLMNILKNPKRTVDEWEEISNTIINNETGTEEELLRKIDKKGNTINIISAFPNKNEKVVINKLLYKVTYVDKQLGKVFLKLI